MDIYKSASKITNKRCIKAGSDVVKQIENPFLSNLLYPILQCLDEKFLEADAQFGGIDQRKIFTLSQEVF